MNQTAIGSWDPEDGIDAENINPEVPQEVSESLVWTAIRVAIDASETKEEVLRRVKGWNKDNNPELPEKELVQKVLWALRKWDTKFKETK